MKFIDLSVPLNENTPVYPGDPKTKIQPGGVLGKDGYEDHYVCIGTHAGTHIDAPRHMVAMGKNLDQMPLDRFIGQGVYVRVGKKFSVYAFPIKLQIDGAPTRVIAEIIK